MEKVAFDDLPGITDDDLPDRRDLDDALGATDVAIKYYEVQPGTFFSGSFHTHHTQEEIFVVLEGEATWDTEEGEAAMTLSAGEAVRFPPGEFQHGYVAEDADETVRALALGAPPGMDDTVSIFTCPSCGEEAKHDVDIYEDRARLDATCRECGNVIVNERDD